MALDFIWKSYFTNISDIDGESVDIYFKYKALYNRYFHFIENIPMRKQLYIILFSVYLYSALFPLPSKLVYLMHVQI